MACCGDGRLWNIIVLGISFMLIFTAFQTSSMVEKTVLDSISNFSGSGYTSLGIVYIVFSLSNWGAPSVVSVAGPKMSMIFGSIMYFLFVLSFLKPMVWSLYLGSALVGIGAAVLWTAQGNFLTINSTSQTVARNSGIFWALFQSSLLIGNLYSYFVFKGKKNISYEERTKLYIALSAASVAGTLFLFLLRRRNTDSDDLVSLQSPVEAREPDSPWRAFVRSLQLMKTREILLLCFSFFYTGLELTFFSGVYGTCISHNEHFGDAGNGLIGISGIFIGVGEIFGGLLFGLLGKKTNVYGRDIIVMLGYVVHMVAFYLAFINLPQQSPVDDTDGPTYLESNKYVALLGSFLLGLGDSSFNTQLYSLLGCIFPEDSSPAFALFKFVQSVAAAIGFYYSNVLVLQWQLLILVVTGTLGTITFNVVEWESTRAQHAGYSKIGQS